MNKTELRAYRCAMRAVCRKCGIPRYAHGATPPHTLGDACSGFIERKPRAPRRKP